MTEFRGRINPIIVADCTFYKHTVFLKNVIKNTQIEVGDYTYYNDFNLLSGHDYATKLAPYLYEGVPGGL